MGVTALLVTSAVVILVLIWFRPKDDPSIALHKAGVAAWTEFQRTKRDEHLQTANEMHRRALAIRKVGHPLRWQSLAHLSLVVAAMAANSVEGLNEAIRYSQEALKLIPPNNPEIAVVHNGLGSIYLSLFKQSGDATSIDECVRSYHAALDLRPAKDPDRLGSLINLSLAYIQQGQLDGLTNAVSHLQESITLCPPGNPHRYACCGMLATSFSTRFAQSGNIEDLQETVNAYRQALTVASDDQQLPSQINLANAIWKLSEHEPGHVKELKEALAYTSEVLNSNLAQTHPYYNQTVATFSNLLATFSKECDEASELELDKAITLGRHLDDEDPHVLSCIAVAIWYRCERFGRTNDLEEAISYYEQALKLCSSDDLELHLKILNNLAIIYATRYNQQIREEESLQKMVECYQKSVDLCPTDHKDYVVVSQQLSEAKAALQAAMAGNQSKRQPLPVRRASLL